MSTASDGCYRHDTWEWKRGDTATNCPRCKIERLQAVVDAARVRCQQVCVNEPSGSEVVRLATEILRALDGEVKP